MPRPPHEVGVKIFLLDNLLLRLFMNFIKILSISFLNCFEGRGRMVAVWVNFDRRQVLVIFTLAVVVSFR